MRNKRNIESLSVPIHTGASGFSISRIFRTVSGEVVDVPRSPFLDRSECAGWLTMLKNNIFNAQAACDREIEFCS